MSLGMLLLGSCEALFKDVYYDYKKAKAIKTLRLINVALEDESMTKEMVVKYPESYFIAAAFAEGAMAEFNSNAYGVRIMPIKREDYAALQEYLGALPPALASLNTAPNPGFTVKEKLPNKALIHLGRKNLKADEGFISLELTTAVWSQQARGYLRVYNFEGEQVWRHEIKAFSSYIIYDKHSPYLVREKFFYVPINPQSTHRSEIEKAFRKLGEEAALSFKRILKSMHQ